MLGSNSQYNGKMRVSFDLDEVLFVSPVDHKIEKPLIFPLNHIFQENVRLGTSYLIPELQRQGYEVWVYTTSFRTESYIRTLFWFYGVKFDGIVNGQRHKAEIQSRHSYPMPNKLPNYYRISLHVDDEEVVATYGKTYGFDVFQLNAQDDDWAKKIIERAAEIKQRFKDEKAID